MWKYEAVGLMPCGAGTETLCWVLMIFGKEEASGRGFHKFTVDVRDLRGLWPGDRKSSHLSFVTRGGKNDKKMPGVIFCPRARFPRNALCRSRPPRQRVPTQTAGAAQPGWEPPASTFGMLSMGGRLLGWGLLNSNAPISHIIVHKDFFLKTFFLLEQFATG